MQRYSVRAIVKHRYANGSWIFYKEGVEWKLVKARAGVSWLFGGIAVRAWFEEGGMHTGIRIFGIPIDKLLKKKMDKAASAGKRGPKTSEKSGAPDRPGKESVKPGIESDEGGLRC